jgi:hypothetical protein
MLRTKDCHKHALNRRLCGLGRPITTLCRARSEDGVALRLYRCQGEITCVQGDVLLKCYCVRPSAIHDVSQMI